MEDNKIEPTQEKSTILEEKNKKSNTWLIIVVTLIIVALIGCIVLTKLKNNENQAPVNNNGNATTSSDENNSSEKITYTMQEIELVTFVYKNSDGKLEKLDWPSTMVSYPNIKGGDDTVEDLNEKIKTNVDNFIKEYHSKAVLYENQGIDEPGFVSITSDGKKLFYSASESINYRVSQINDYLVIEEYLSYYQEGSGTTKHSTTYTVNKKSGQIVPHEDVINSFENIDFIKTSLIQFIENEDDSYNDIDEKNKFLSDVKTILNENKFQIAYENYGNYAIYFNIEEETYVRDYYFEYNLKEDSWEIPFY